MEKVTVDMRESSTLTAKAVPQANGWKEEVEVEVEVEGENVDADY